MTFLITGPDTYRARQKLAELKAKFLKEVDPSGLNMGTVKGATLTLEEVRHYLESRPLLARRRFIVFDNILAHKKSEILEAVREAMERERGQKEGEDNIAVFFEDEEPTAKNKLCSWLVKHALLFRYPILEGQNLFAWVEEEWRRRGRKITPSALKRLVSVSASGDLWQLSREVQKIDAYLEKGEIVDDRVLGNLINEPFDNNIFSLIDAVVEGHLKKSTLLLMEHLERETTPQQMVALLEKQFRVLLLLSEARHSEAPPAMPGIHPYMVRKLKGLVQKYDSQHLKKIYADLARLDVDLKSSAGDSKTLLLKFLVQSSYSKVSLAAI